MRKQRRHLELRMKMHFSDKAPCSFIAKFLILNAISILPPLRKARICFCIKVRAQKPVRGPETTDNDRKVNHVSYEYETDSGSGLSGPGWPLPWSSSGPGLGDPDLGLIHFAFGTQSTGFQICRQMDGHSYANSLFPVVKCT